MGTSTALDSSTQSSIIQYTSWQPAQWHSNTVNTSVNTKWLVEVCVCVRACMRACVRACVRSCVCVGVVWCGVVWCGVVVWVCGDVGVW